MRVRASPGQRRYWGFCGQSGVNSVGLASLNNSSGFGAREVVSSCLVLGPGMS